MRFLPEIFRRVFLVVLLCVVSAPSVAMPHFKSEAARLAYIRSQAEKAKFARAHVCPSTLKPLMSCPGYVIDHVKPLCDGGADKAINMQWQTIAASYRKDIIERRVCACHKAGRLNCNDPWEGMKKWPKRK